METPLENVLMTSFKFEMISFLNAHPEYFYEAIELALSDKQPYAWRAAWLLHDCMEHNDRRLQKYSAQIIEALPAKKDGHRRELLKVLLKLELDETLEGYLFDLCISMWEKINQSPSVRYTAFIGILRIAEKYPELSNEIAFFTQNQYMETLSPGIKNSLVAMAAKFLKKQKTIE